MRKLILALACALAAIVTAQAQRGPLVLNARVPFESKTVKGIPYSAELVSENTQVLADGNRIVQRTTGRVYRDSEGRVRREEDRAVGGNAKKNGLFESSNISVTDVMARTSFTLNPARHEAVQTPLPMITAFAGDRLFFATSADGTQRDAADARKREAVQSSEGRGGRGGPPGDAERQREFTPAAELVIEGEKLAIVRGFLNSGEESAEDRLPDRLIGGVVASGTRRTTTIAAGAIGNEQPIKIISEEWFSPELQILVMTEHTDPRTGRSTYQLSDINRNEPDPSLFQIPADYTIRRSGIR